MLDELLTLYNQDKDFAHFVDAYKTKHQLSLRDVLDHKILREYAKYIREKKRP